MEHSNLTKAGKKSMDLIEFDTDEKLVGEIHKHPIGLLLTWFVGIFIAVAILGATMGAIFLLNGDRLHLGADLSSARPFVAVIGMILILLVLAATALTAYIYRRNIILITDEKIAEIAYVSIFNRKITQLDLSDIQDVAVEQKGIFPRVFGYGTMVIETAGERENITFTYAPYPYRCAKQIIGAREDRKNSMATVRRQPDFESLPPQPQPPTDTQPSPGGVASQPPTQQPPAPQQ